MAATGPYGVITITDEPQEIETDTDRFYSNAVSIQNASADTAIWYGTDDQIAAEGGPFIPAGGEKVFLKRPSIWLVCATGETATAYYFKDGV